MDDNVEQLLNQALSQYSTVDIPIHLDNRILGVINRRAIFRKLSVAAGSLAALAATLFLLVHPESRRFEPAMRQVSLVVPVSLPTPKLEIPALPPKAVGRSTFPKLDVFPSPSPMTAQERALVAMSRRFPQETEKLLSTLTADHSGPIEIQPLVIAPLPDPVPLGENR